MADDESRAARQKALAEKKRRLEEIKARRRQPGGAAAAPASSANAATSTTATSSSSAAAGLDSYIDDLLNTSAPGLTLVTPAAEAPAAVVEEKTEVKKAEDAKKDETSATTADAAGGATASTTAAATAQPQRPVVETFEIAIQCEEDDFPPPSLVDEDEPADDKDSDDSDEDDEDDDNEKKVGDNQPIRRGLSSGSAILPSSASYDSHSFKLNSKIASAEPLSNEEKSEVFNSPPFAHFLSTAGKRVERLLGAGEENLYGILGGSGWGATGATGGDFSVDYANEEEEDYEDDDDDELADGVGASSISKKKRRSKKAKEEAYQTGGFFSARATYEFPKFTRGRSVTDVEWCPGHKEWVLASYNAVGAGARAAGSGEGEAGAGAGTAGMALQNNNPTTRHLSPNNNNAAGLSSFSASAIPNEGIVAIYNLSMPSRPEHVFCAGCPILHSKFHPTEHPKLILGGASSGQVLVWDARVGRYPVQRSGGGHDCELVGMKVLGGNDASAGGGGGGAGGSITTSKLVTASSDGKINYWSVANLREPAECVQVNANLSSLEILHGSNNEGILCGDEKGGLHTVMAGTGRDGSSSNKRVVRTLHPGGVGAGDGSSASAEDDPDAAALEELAEMGHFGMVTSVAARPTMPHVNTPRGGNKETTSSSTMGGGSMSKGFLRGAGGLVVTTGVDWSTKLWAPAYSDGPLMSFLSNSYDYMCDAQWSPVHPSVFATASSNGTLNIWNLATTLEQPVSGTEGIPIEAGASSGVGGADAASSSRQGLNRLQWSSDGRRMAVAAGDKLHVLGVGEDVWKSKGDEEGRVMHNLTSRGLIQE